MAAGASQIRAIAAEPLAQVAATGYILTRRSMYSFVTGNAAP